MSHPVLSAIAAMHAALDEIAGVDPTYMSVADKKAAMVETARLRARAEALDLALLVAGAGDVADETGARSTAAWLADQTREAPGAVRHRAALAATLDSTWTKTAQALAVGVVNLAQTRAITGALEDLPTDLGEALLCKAETYLLDQAADLGPRELRNLGRGLLHYLAPDIADEHELRRLEAQEAAAAAVTKLTFRPRGDGTTDLHVRLPDHVAHRLHIYLNGYTSPRSKRLGDVDDLPLPRRRGLAFCALLENLPASGLPRQGGVATTVSVKIDYQTLLADLTAAGLAMTSTGDAMTADQARRLACQAGILPHVMSGKSVVLDQGRSKRLHDENQRAAIHLVHDTCSEVGCDIPVAWTEIHHPVPWALGGTTDLSGIPLCPFHHHRAHDPGWITHHQANGKTSFTRRQ